MNSGPRPHLNTRNLDRSLAARELRFTSESKGPARHLGESQRREALKLLALWEELEELHAQTRFWREEAQRAGRPVDQLRGLVGTVCAGVRLHRADQLPPPPESATEAAAPAGYSASQDASRGDDVRLSTGGATVAPPPPTAVAPAPLVSALKKTEPVAGAGGTSAACLRARQYADARRRKAALEALQLREGAAEGAPPGAAPAASTEDAAADPTPRVRTVTWC